MKWKIGLKVPSWCYQCRSFLHKDLISLSPYLCQSCYAELPWVWQPACEQCGLNHEGEVCNLPEVPNIYCFYSIFRYDFPINRWIGRVKYQGDFLAARVLQNLISIWFAEFFIENEKMQIVPIPIHSKSLFSRGFNQTELLLQKQKQLPLQPKFLKKIRSTYHQVGLNREERVKNLSGAFVADPDCTGSSILIFDDVSTTGRTFEIASEVLIRAGASHVSVLSLARGE